MTDPTFIVIGGQKCGTTWMYAMLRQHPAVLTSRIKEVHYFDKLEHYSKGIDWYRRQFPDAGGGTAVGEFTPNYLSPSWDFDDIPALVARDYPFLRLIVSLRDPVERAISAYYHHIRAGRVLPADRILDVKDQHGIVTMGLYEQHLRQWRQYFAPDQMLCLIYEEDLSDRWKCRTLQRICRHLGVDEAFHPEGLTARFNERTSDAGRPPVRDFEREALQRIFLEPSRRLAGLLGRPLPWPWLTS
jgi:sulfotransferase family protein